MDFPFHYSYSSLTFFTSTWNRSSVPLKRFLRLVRTDWIFSEMDDFICGFAYGLVNVIVGQPFDVLKTTLQTNPQKKGVIAVGVELFKDAGIRGLYRGGMTLVIGGGLIRSTQFGFNTIALEYLRKSTNNLPLTKEQRLFQVIDYQKVGAGLIGGIGRGLVETPFEFIKVRRQIQAPWKLKDVYNGAGPTIFRNSILFSAFVSYRDLTNFAFGGFPNAFTEGAVCASLAWLTVWPLDVVKSQIQSGLYKDKSYFDLLFDTFRKGLFFRGLGPGIARASIANGFSMMAYNKTEEMIKEYRANSTR